MTLANIIYRNFFKRFPNTKMGSAENGSNWQPGFLEKMEKMRGMTKNGYWPCGQLKDRPRRIVKRNFYVVAYPKDDVKGTAERIGSVDCIVMGSDLPHAEKVPEPRDFYNQALSALAPEAARAVMYDNRRQLLPMR